MKCERCQFENIPGSKTCVKCGVILESTGEQENVYPPRMSKLAAPIRYLARLIRRCGILSAKRIMILSVSWISSFLDDIITGLVFSVLPGFAHLIQKRFKEIRWLFIVWLMLIMSGLFLYGSTAGVICIGMAIGAHTAIAIQYKALQELESIFKIFLLIIIVFISLLFAYRGISGRIIPNLTGSYSTLEIPGLNMAAGDYLLGWNNPEDKLNIKRGDLVLIYPNIVGGHNMEGVKSRTYTVVQIVATAGERLEIKDGVFIINGQKLDPNTFPVQQWLKNYSYSVTIQENSYFISIQYNVNANNMDLNDEYINNVCIINSNDIESKIFMRWMPLMKKGLIK